MIGLLKIKVLFPVNYGIGGEELSEVEQIRLKNEGLLTDGDDFESEYGYYNVGADFPLQLNPRCFVPKNKTKKRYYTQIVFPSEFEIMADGKPEEIYKILCDWWDKLPDK